MKGYYAGIGSRKTPQHVLELMTKIASKLEQDGYVLRSGHAEGADLAFELGVTNPDMKQIFTTTSHPITTNASNSVYKYHAVPHKLSPYAFKLMARNYYQINGYCEDNQPKSKFVICWTPDGCTKHEERTIKTGGTGQAISVASSLGIPVFNLANETEYIRFRKYVGDI